MRKVSWRLKEKLTLIFKSFSWHRRHSIFHFEITMLCLQRYDNFECLIWYSNKYIFIYRKLLADWRRGWLLLQAFLGTPTTLMLASWPYCHYHSLNLSHHLLDGNKCNCIVHLLSALFTIVKIRFSSCLDWREANLGLIFWS